jgi:uncharacterized protein
MGAEREILDWELFGTAARELAKRVADNGYEPEMILSIARGGLLVGGALGYALDVKNVYTMKRRVLHRRGRAARGAAHPPAGA